MSAIEQEKLDVSGRQLQRSSKAATGSSLR
jgi:hypothetical protein